MGLLYLALSRSRAGESTPAAGRARRDALLLTGSWAAAGGLDPPRVPAAGGETGGGEGRSLWPLAPCCVASSSAASEKQG